MSSVWTVCNLCGHLMNHQHTQECSACGAGAEHLTHERDLDE